MNNRYFYTQDGATLKRIDRRKAAAAYNNGLDVLFIPCNLNPVNNFYNLGIWENKALDGQYRDFTALVNAFEYYNCNAETGRYTAFYIPVKTVDRFTGEAPTAATLGTVESYDYNYRGI